jgi:hypothetical protein
MNFYEFISDEYAHFTYVQHFEGLFLNSIPVVKNWKWRNFAFVKAAYGNLNSSNYNLTNVPKTPDGQITNKINSFKDKIPYVEVGYGFENIFRIISINMVHRLTYLDQQPNQEKLRAWGINIGLRFQF